MEFGKQQPGQSVAADWPVFPAWRTYGRTCPSFAILVSMVGGPSACIVGVACSYLTWLHRAFCRVGWIGIAARARAGLAPAKGALGDLVVTSLLLLQVRVPVSPVPDFQVIPYANQDHLFGQASQLSQLRRNPNSPLTIHLDALSLREKQATEGSHVPPIR